MRLGLLLRLSQRCIPRSGQVHRATYRRRVGWAPVLTSATWVPYEEVDPPLHSSGSECFLNGTSFCGRRDSGVAGRCRGSLFIGSGKKGREKACFKPIFRTNTGAGDLQDPLDQHAHTHTRPRSALRHLKALGFVLATVCAKLGQGRALAGPW